MGENASRELYIQDNTRAVVVDNPESTLVWLGDLVLPEGYTGRDAYLQTLAGKFDPARVLIAGGHFYCFFYAKKQKHLTLLTGFAGILPVYYTQTSQKVFISSDMDLILAASRLKPQVSRRFIMEKLIFNYPLFQHTIVRDVWLLPAHHLIRLSASFQMDRYFDPTTLINNNPSSARESLSALSWFFQRRLKRYWPDEPFALSFTGGFDGRTLLACALREHRDFFTYAFGRSGDRDLLLPEKQAPKLKIPFLPIYLDDPRYLKDALHYGLEFVKHSAGTADMARAHYVHAAKTLAQQRTYLLTGNFGSELFRAMHLTGEMTAFPTYLLFAGRTPDEVIKWVKNSADYKLLNHPGYQEAEEELTDDLSKFHYPDDSLLSTNQRFYMFILEEMFRKYFGPEIIMQNHYLINRTPYLDFQFVRELFSTRLAGVHNDFYMHNPVKRKTGQLFYAGTIKDTHRRLYHMKTGKGYAPSDLSHPLGNLALGWNLIRKQLHRNGQPEDPFSVRLAFMNNLDAIKRIPIHPEYFDEDCMSKRVSEIDTASHRPLLKAYSLNWYIHHLSENA